MSSYTNIFGGTAVVPSQPSYEALTISENTALLWPLEVLEGTPYVAAQIDVTATVGSLDLLMPPGNTGSNGAQTIVTNVGSDTFTVTDTSGNAIAVIATTQSWLITLTDNSTTNGTWRGYQLASTTSSGVASALAGPGLQAIGSQLQTIWNTSYLSVDTLVTSSYRSTAIVWQGADGTLQLDTIANLTTGWFCAVTNEGTGTVEISTSGGQTINGASTLVLPPGDGGVIVCSSSGFNSFGALISPLGIPNGGTGASTAPAALTNLGGTAIGQAIFTAPNAASVVALLGLNNFTFTELSVSTAQVLAATSTNTVFVCTAALSLTLPLTTTLNKTFVFAAYAQGGAVTITPQAADAINGGSAGSNLVIAEGGSALFVTDANGNWWPLFNDLPLSGGIVAGNLTVDGTLAAAGVTTILQSAGPASGSPLRADQAWTELLSYTLTGASSQAIVFPTGYRRYRLTMQGITVGTATASIVAQFSINGGSSYISSSSYQQFGFYLSSTSMIQYNQTATNCLLSIGLSTTSGAVADGTFDIYPGTASLNPMISGPAAGFASGSTWFNGLFSNILGSAGAAANAIKVFPSSGTFSGVLILEGLP